MRQHKYNAKKVTIDGHTFDSKAEAARYSELKLLERAGEIRDLQLQPRFIITPPYVNAAGKKVRASYYMADFMYDDKDGNTVIEDVKGHQTETYKLKKKIVEYLHEVTITEIKR